MRKIISLFIMLVASNVSAAVDVEMANSVDLTETKDLYLDDTYKISLRNCTPAGYANVNPSLEVIGSKYECAVTLFGRKMVGAYFGKKNGQVYFQYLTPLTGFTYSIERIDGNRIYLIKSVEVQP